MSEWASSFLAEIETVKDMAPDILIVTRPAKPTLGGSFTSPVVRPICRYPVAARRNRSGKAGRPDQFTCAVGLQQAAETPREGPL